MKTLYHIHQQYSNLTLRKSRVGYRRILFSLVYLISCVVISNAQEKIKMTFDGQEVYVIDSNRIDVKNAGHNVFIGRNVAASNGAGATDSLHGTRNVGVGARAMEDNTTGFSNVGVGFHALKSNLEGFSNTAMGYHSMAANQGGSHNTAIGEGALEANIGGNANTALGDDALLRKTTGHKNTAIGQAAMENLIDGHGNVALGFRAGSAETGSNRLYIHNDSTDIGKSLIYGEFDNNLLRINGELQIGTTYKLPLDAGFPGDVLMTDGLGNTAWQLPPDGDPYNELIDSINFNFPYLEFYQAGLPFPFHTVDLYWLFEDADPDPLNEIQFISTVGDSLFISDGNGVKLNGGNSTSIIDVDGDTRIEAFDFLFSDKIDVSVDGNNYLRLAGNRIGFLNTNNSIVISDTAGIAPGNHNTFIGVGTGNANVTGDNNTFVGSGSGANIFTGSGNVYIGKDAGAGTNNDNSLFIENSNSANPLIYGEFDTDRVGINGKLAVGHQQPSAQLHVKANMAETARFESIDNTFVSFYKNDEQKGLIQSFFDDFLIGKTSGPGTGSVQLYNQGTVFAVKDNGGYSFRRPNLGEDILIDMRRDGNQHGFIHIKDDLFNGVNNNLHIGKPTTTGNIALENNGHYIFLEPDGDVGIGTNDGLTINPIPNKLRLESDNTAPALSSNVTYSGSVDVVAVEGYSKPTVGYGIGAQFTGGWTGIEAVGSGGSYVGQSTGIKASASGTAGTRIGIHASATGGTQNWAGYFHSGNVYVADSLRIGTTQASSIYQLAVDGKMIAEELKIQDSGNWPDYVFAEDYNLMPLDEVEAHIQEKKHLPGIPSAADIEENGIEVGDMQKKMMEKIEELTLHVIELQKRIQELEANR